MSESTKPDTASGEPSSPDRDLDLLYPFYLDVDMSMAFAAALTGGVALEEEQIDRASDTSRAIRNIRGNLNLWRAGGFGAGSEREAESGSVAESRLILRHTEASIFIALHDELLQRQKLRREPAIEDISVGDLIEVEMGPAVAPLRRVVDQIIRLLDLVAPMLGLEVDDPIGPPPGTAGKGGQRSGAKPAAKPTSDEARQFNTLRRLVSALRDDLDRAGMIDVVVRRDGLPGVVLTLDKRFATDTALELLHTSRFTVIGKVTQVWWADSDIVNLYRRSVLWLVPALAQGVAWNLFGLLGLAGKAIDASALQNSVSSALGIQAEAEPSASGHDESASELQESPARAAASVAPDVMFNEEAINALLPVVPGPALQLLPLAICA